MDAAAGLAFDLKLAEGVFEHQLKIFVEARELPVILDDDFEIVLVGDRVDVDVPAVFEHVVVPVLKREGHRAAEAGLLASAVEVEDAASFRHLFGVFLEVSDDFIGKRDAGRVVHRALRGDIVVFVAPAPDEQAAESGDKRNITKDVKEDVEPAGVDDIIGPVVRDRFDGGLPEQIGNKLRRFVDVHALVEKHDGINDGHKDAKQPEPDRRDGAEADLRVGPESALERVFLPAIAEFGMTPVPGRVRVPGKDDSVIIFAVLGRELAVGVLRDLLAEEAVEPASVKENAADQPDQRAKADDAEPDPERLVRESEIDERGKDDADRAGVWKTADRGARRDGEFLGHRLDPDRTELVRHIFMKFPFVRAPRKPGTDLFLGVGDDLKRLVDIFARFGLRPLLLLRKNSCFFDFGRGRNGIRKRHLFIKNFIFVHIASFLIGG